MNRLLLRSAGRFYRRHPWQLMLAVVGIALGVAVYVGVDLANSSARRAFELSAELVRGATSHRLLPVGGAMNEQVFAGLVTGGLADRAAPVVTVNVRVGSQRGPRYALLGVDPIEEAGFREYSSVAIGQSSSALRLIMAPGSVLVPAALAQSLGLTVGDPVPLWVDGARREASVAGLIDTSAEFGNTLPPLVADIATAQEFAGRVGTLDWIDLGLTPPQARRLSARPPTGTTLVVAGRENAALDAMMGAFSTNLAALGLLALAVGMFLIYSTISFAIVQRRPVIAVLRALGMGRRQLVANFMAEALLLGTIGTACGLVLGYWLASVLVAMVLQTIGDLYFSTAVAAAAPSAGILLQGAMLGVGATLVAALAPALEAAREATDQALTRAALERRSRRRSRYLGFAAVPVLLIAGCLLAIDSGGLLLAFAAMALVLLAGAMLTPAITLALSAALERPAAYGFGYTGLLAVRGVGASLSRTGVAASALAAAVATVIGVGLMIESFRSSLGVWLDTTLTADIYVSVGDDPDGLPLSEPDLEALAARPEFGGLSPSRLVRLPSDYGELGLRATQPGPRGWGLNVVRGSEAPLNDASNPRTIALAEPLAFRLELDVGDTMTLPTPAGPQNFTIVAVFRDYNAGGSGVLMPLESYRRHWNDSRLTGLGIDLADGVTELSATTVIRQALGDAAEIRSSASIEAITMRIFDRTFRITEVLRFMAGLIAFLGVLSAMLAIQLERTRELAILRGLGFAPADLAKQVLVQTGLLGLCAGLAALPLGSGLAAILVHVINRRAFGWTMEFDLALQPLVLGLALAVCAALLAGIYPAWHSSQTGLEEALQDE